MKSAPDKAAAPAVMPARRPSGGVAGLRPVAGLIPGITRKAFEKHGFAAASLITDWVEIVGPDLARMTRPLKLKWPRAVETYGEPGEDQRGRPGAVLTLSVDPAAALDVQYQTGRMVERINGYFGYRAITDVRLVQAGSDSDFLPPPIAQATPRRTSAPATAAARPPASDQIAAVGDDQLRAALERLAASIGRRTS